ncbi:hypothetical protein ACFFRR_000185 [Megaselia abdita]
MTTQDPTVITEKYKSLNRMTLITLSIFLEGIKTSMQSECLTSIAKMLSSVIPLLVLFVVSCRCFKPEEFLNNYCQQSSFQFSKDQLNIDIDLLCHNFNFNSEDIEDIQHRDFIISNKTSIYIENAKIGILNEKFFEKFPNALEIILRDVEMKLQSSAIENSNNKSQLKTLRLLNCQLHENKETTAFNGLQSLELIEIRSATLDNKEIGSNFFEGCPKLKKISLTRSQITNIGKDVFRNLLLLRYLDISQLGLNGESFSSYSLVNNNNLEYLDLSSNEFKDIVSLPVSLKMFNVSQNQISKISKSDFQNLPVLEELSLDDNNLDDIPEDSFGGMKSLVTLSLARNKIHRISEETFKNLPKLKNLNLQQNLIAESPTGLDGINVIFNPQKDIVTTTESITSSRIRDSSTTTSTTTVDPDTASLKPEVGSAESITSSRIRDSSTTTSTTTVDPDTASLKPAVGSAQTSSGVSLLCLSFLMVILAYLH